MSFFGSEKTNVRTVATAQGAAPAIGSATARQTYVPLPSTPAGQAATYGGKVPAVCAGNARQTHVT